MALLFLATLSPPTLVVRPSPRLAGITAAPNSAARSTPCVAAADEPPPTTPTAQSLQEEPLTKVGSKSYYEGFFTQPVDANVTEERGDGTEQAVKFAASGTAIIAVLFLGFMASNGLL